jgi:hypothetical protein
MEQLAQFHTKDNFMLQGIKQSCGEIGHVKDFYFDDRNWAGRYLVTDTGTWLTSRQVDRISYEKSTVFVNLTKEAVEQSPSNHLIAVA